jgi:hypothetical protein
MARFAARRVVPRPPEGAEKDKITGLSGASLVKRFSVVMGSPWRERIAQRAAPGNPGGRECIRKEVRKLGS